MLPQVDTKLKQNRTGPLYSLKTYIHIYSLQVILQNQLMQLNIHEHHNTKKDDNYNCNTLQISVQRFVELKKKKEKEKKWIGLQECVFKV